MKICLAKMRGKPVELELRDNVVYLDGVAEPIKNLTEEDLRAFQAEIDALPTDDDTGHEALANAVRAAFIAKLLGRAVGDECVGKLTQILDHVHYDVLKYLGEVEED